MNTLDHPVAACVLVLTVALLVVWSLLDFVAGPDE